MDKLISAVVAERVSKGWIVVGQSVSAVFLRKGRMTVKLQACGV